MQSCCSPIASASAATLHTTYQKLERSIMQFLILGGLQSGCDVHWIRFHTVAMLVAAAPGISMQSTEIHKGQVGPQMVYKAIGYFMGTTF